jgi:outer membrane protein OmpA-like peptidoglycan-associated protein
MSMRITLAASATIALMATVFIADATAQVIYFGGEGGWSHLNNESERFAVRGAPSVRTQYDEGFAAGARIGYEMGPWRFEEEYAYRSNDLNKLSVAGVTVPGTTSSRRSHAVMSNLIYDVNLGWPVTPHIGAGIGAVDVIGEAKRTAAPSFRLSDNDWQFGYQAIAGVRYNISPNLAFDLDYRYLATTDATFRVPGTTVKFKSGYDTHNLMASLVYRFGPPPVLAPAPPPAPAVARRVFLVFFDWDRATITQDGMRIVQQAADAYRSGAPVQIQVTGYTDASGSVGYNQRLSERRANAVADAMTRLGVARSDMLVSGRGKNDQRVPTADGVREPQNRRVEIVFP